MSHTSSLFLTRIYPAPPGDPGSKKGNSSSSYMNLLGVRTVIQINPFSVTTQPVVLVRENGLTESSLYFHCMSTICESDWLCKRLACDRQASYESLLCKNKTTTGMQKNLHPPKNDLPEQRIHFSGMSIASRCVMQNNTSS